MNNELKEQTKFCQHCETAKPISDFHQRGGKRKNECQVYCKKCYLEIKKEHRNNDVMAEKNRRLRIMYGINLQIYKEMLLQQNGVCAICKQPETSVFRGKLKHLCVDHNHKTGEIRGLLCDSCNKGIGYFREKSEFLDSAINYLGFWQNKSSSKLKYHTTF